jgi:hypothetical protein
MDRNIVYPGSIPLDTDLLSLNRNTMLALGYLARAAFGTSPIVDGLSCVATAPPSMQLTIGPGCISVPSVMDSFAYGSLPADTVTPLIKMGITTSQSTFTLTAPAVSGQSNAYLIQATFQEVDTNPVVLPFYNAANPAQPYSGPSNSGSPQNTVRSQQVALQLKLATSSNGALPMPPPVDTGWVGLYSIIVGYGKTSITNADILCMPTAPFIYWKMPALRPGFGTGSQVFTSSGTFSIPAGVSQVEVEVWGGGSGSFASVAGQASGGGSGGGYARKRITSLIPGQSIVVTVGGGGAAGRTTGAPPTAGGASSFGSFVSASGGSLNYLSTTTNPANGATPPGCGIGGDVNLSGSAGLAGVLNQGGMGAAAPMGGAQNSGTTGVAGIAPGGGASGAGTGANSATPYDGAAGAPGMVVVRW